MSEIIQKCDGHSPPARHHWLECSDNVIKLRSWSSGGRSNWYIATRDPISDKWDVIYARMERDTERMPEKGEVSFRTQEETRGDAIEYMIGYGRASYKMGFM